MAKKAPKLSAKLPLTDNGTLPKADVLERWGALPAGKQLNPAARPYGQAGSAYEGDSLRITGSLKWLDQVLSNLKGLLRHDNTRTVLDLKYSEQKEREGGQRRGGQYVLYLQVKEKARTTRAKAATPTPARATSARAPKATPAPKSKGGLTPVENFVADFTDAGRAVVKEYHTQQVADALAGLATLGYKRADAEQRLAAVVERHGKKLAAAEYIKLVLTHSK